MVLDATTVEEFYDALSKHETPRCTYGVFMDKCLSGYGRDFSKAVGMEKRYADFIVEPWHLHSHLILVG